VPRGEPIKNPLETEPLNIFAAVSRKQEINVIDNHYKTQNSVKYIQIKINIFLNIKIIYKKDLQTSFQV